MFGCILLIFFKMMFYMAVMKGKTSSRQKSLVLKWSKRAKSRMSLESTVSGPYMPRAMRMTADSPKMS